MLLEVGNKPKAFSLADCKSEQIDRKSVTGRGESHPRESTENEKSAVLLRLVQVARKRALRRKSCRFYTLVLNKAFYIFISIRKSPICKKKYDLYRSPLFHLEVIYSAV